MAKKMFSFRASSSLMLVPLLLGGSQAHIPARPVVQERAAYGGGWPLAIPGTTCPSDAPVACAPNSGFVNPNCCPTGQTCIGELNPHCCPTDVECENVVSNFPVCANQTWNMYELDLGSRTFFCCEPGQYGVLPISGYTGICEPVDMVVASSLVATAATQNGATGAATAVVFPATTGTTTSTLANGALTTVVTTVAGSTSVLAGMQTGAGSGSASNTAGAGHAAVGSSSVTLSKGALIAIIVCAIIVPLLFLVALLVFWRKRRAEKMREGGPMGGGGAPVYAAAPQPKDKSPGVAYVAPYAEEEHGYGKSELPPSEVRQERVVEQATQKWEGRVEMD